MMALMLPALLMVVGACGPSPKTDDAPKPAVPVARAGSKLQIGYVLHGLNDFTQVIKRAKAHKISHRMSAMAAGVERVMKAKGTRGLFP